MSEIDDPDFESIDTPDVSDETPETPTDDPDSVVADDALHGRLMEQGRVIREQGERIDALEDLVLAWLKAVGHRPGPKSAFSRRHAAMIERVAS